MTAARVLLTVAVALTLADAAAFALVIGAGSAREMNPLVAALPPTYALGARAALLVALCALTFIASVAGSRALRLTVGAALVVAIAIGALGAGTTALAALS